MTIEVIRCDIDQASSVAPEADDVLELETRQLTDRNRAFGEERRDLAERDPDVAADLVRQAGGAEHRSDKLCRRRLAVGARHAHNTCAGRQQAIAELDLGPDGYASFLRCLQHRMPAGYARAPNDRLAPVVVDLVG